MTAVDPTTEKPGNRSRRDVLCGLLVAVVAPGALVAACGDDSPSTDSGGGTTTGGGTTAGGGESAKGLAALADVPDGGGLVVDGPDGEKILLVRTGQDVKAYNAACTHKGFTVDAPKGGVVTCPEHGSQFDAGTGDVRGGPASRPLVTMKVSVEGEQVVLA